MTDHGLALNNLYL